MSRFLRASIIILLLGSCGGGRFSAPRELDNACSIVRERPEYYRAMQATERKWGGEVFLAHMLPAMTGRVLDPNYDFPSSW